MIYILEEEHEELLEQNMARWLPEGEIGKDWDVLWFWASARPHYAWYIWQPGNIEMRIML